MTIDHCNWQDHKDIGRWMDEWRLESKSQGLDFDGQTDPLEELRYRLNRGDFLGKEKASVEAFFRATEARSHRVSEHGKADREERALAAAERAADASDRSATWAAWSISVSIAALLVAAWPYVREWLN